MIKRHKSVNKKVKNATPYDYDKIHFKSKLEVYCYQQLKKYNLEANYEPIRFTILESFTYNGEKVRAMTYTPDFVGVDFVIEVKGNMNDAFPLRWKIFKYFLYRNNLNYTLYLPRNKKDVDKVIQDIIERRKNEGLLRT